MTSEVFKQCGPGGMDAINPGDDRVLTVVEHGAGQDLLLQTSAGKILRTPLDPVSLKKTPSAGGIALMKLDSNDLIVSAIAVPSEKSATSNDHLLIMHENGSAKLTALSEIPTKGLRGGGVTGASPDKPSRNPAGPVAMTAAVVLPAPVKLISTRGQALDVDPTTAPFGARAAVSKPWLALGPGDQPALIFP